MMVIQIGEQRLTSLIEPSRAICPEPIALLRHLKLITTSIMTNQSFCFIAALKAESSRLKNEKFDLINEMKELYEALDDKEKQIRDFIRNYEHVSVLQNRSIYSSL